MKELLKQYKQSLKAVKDLHEITEDKVDKEMLGSMISSLQYSIQWMKTGRNPDNLKRGAECPYRTTWDPVIIEQWHNSKDDDPYNMIGRKEQQPRIVTEEKLFKIDEAMSTCTEREKIFYKLYRVDYLSYQEIADKFGVSKSTVQTTIERAKEKIKIQLETNLFLT